MKVVIISGGQIQDEFALDWLSKNAYDCLIAADAGMEFLFRNGIVPDVIAGDFDSVKEDALKHFQELARREGGAASQDTGKIPQVIPLNPVKDDTDTEYVLREAIRRGATEVSILGATGTRLDHMLANVYLLGIGLDAGVKIQLVDAHNRIRMISGSLCLEKAQAFGDYVSILPVAGKAKGVSLRGFKYPLENAEMEVFSSLGISNEIVDETAYIEVKEGILLVIESRD